jgi:hypothetical protein
MYLLDNLADSADCGGLTLTLATIVKIPKGGCHRVQNCCIGSKLTMLYI